MSESSHYARASADLRRSLSNALPPEVLRDLTRRRPARHFLVVARMFGRARGERGGVGDLRAVVPLGPLRDRVRVHHLRLHGPAPRGRAQRGLRTATPRRTGVLGWLYAFPSGVSRGQFTRWHLDHHAQLGDPVARPEAPPPVAEAQRALVEGALPHARALFIYFRAARAGDGDVPGRAARPHPARAAFDRRGPARDPGGA